MLGLDRGGSCVGIAYRLTAAARADSIRRLYEREIPNWDDRVHLPVVIEARLPCGTRIDALTFAADRDRPAYPRPARVSERSSPRTMAPWADRA